MENPNMTKTRNENRKSAGAASTLPPIIRTLLGVAEVEQKQRQLEEAEAEAVRLKQIKDRGDARRRAALKAAMDRFASEEQNDPRFADPSAVFDLFDMEMTDPFEAGTIATGVAQIDLTLRMTGLAPIWCVLDATPDFAAWNKVAGWVVVPNQAANALDGSGLSVVEIGIGRMREKEIELGDLRRFTLREAILRAYEVEQRLYDVLRKG
jgi:hypothetical protein